MLNCWIVPCNVKYFDVVAHFKQKRTVIWKNISSVQPGDIVYIYLGAPHKELRYKCVVLNANVGPDVLLNNDYAMPRRPVSSMYQVEIKYMELELVDEYPIGSFVLQELRSNGLGQVQVQAKVANQLQEYIDAKCAALGFC